MRILVTPSQLNPQEFEQFQKLIFQLSGIRVPENKVMLLSNRIRRRLKATGAADFQAYLALMRSPRGREELDGFLSAVTTNETSFFRTEKHFEWLQSEFVDDLVERARTGKHAKRIRIWSAACSTGEEIYTIAMCLAESRIKLAGWKCEILGTDISASALEKAQAGVYSTETLNDVPEKLRSRYFERDAAAKTWSAKPILREMVTIASHNLMEPRPERDFDCIFIRNVLIYFSRESKQIVVDHLIRSLAVGGYLVVGPSEGIFDMLGKLQKRSTFLYQKTEPVPA